MKRIKAWAKHVAASVAAVFAFSAPAFAQLTDITSANVDGLLGVATSGSETGIHELAVIVPIGLAVCITIALAFAGYHLVRRLFMRAQSA